MQYTLIACLFVAFINCSKAQEKNILNIQFSNKWLLVNKVNINTESSIQDLSNVLGITAIKQDLESGKASYLYSSLGILVIAKNDKIESINIKLNSNSNKKTDHQSENYSSKLFINGNSIHQLTNPKSLIIDGGTISKGGNVEDMYISTLNGYNYIMCYKNGVIFEISLLLG